MNKEQNALNELAKDVENFMRNEASKRGLSYISLRAQLFGKWLVTTAFEDNEIESLNRALHCKQAQDDAGYRTACLDFLKLRHGAELGDQVNLHGFPMARDVTLEDYYIEFDEADMLGKSVACFIGPCRGMPALTQHRQPLSANAVRTNRK